MLFELVVQFLDKHSIIIPFLVGFITGESFIIPLAFLSASGLINLWKVLVFCTLGMFFSEFIPFTIGRIPSVRNFFEKMMVSEKTKKIEKKIHKNLIKRPFLTLLSAKFIYGLSIPTIIYFGYKKVHYYKFAVYAFLVNLIFAPLIVLVGWFGGKQFTSLISLFEDMRIALLILIILLVLFFYLQKWLSHKLMKMQEQ